MLKSTIYICCCHPFIGIVNQEKTLTIFIQEQEEKDGVTADGKSLAVETDNVEGEVCAKCGKVGNSLLVCSVSVNER